MSSMEWLKLVGLSKKYSDLKTIGAIDFSIQKGEIFALCGANGAGKSTLIQMLTGILAPSAGKLLLEGQEISPDSREFKRIFSYMPDEMLFPKQLTGLEILTFFAKLRHIPQEKINESLYLVGLYDERNRQVKQYSKGMQQRLALAQALLPDVPLRILDEPTNGLDPFWVYRFKEIMLDEKRQGRTILFTTHILGLVEELADRAAFMEDGMLQYCDSIHALTHRSGTKTPLEKVFFK